MDRNTVTGLLLIAAIILSVTFFFNEKKPAAGNKAQANTEKAAIQDHAPTDKLPGEINNGRPDTAGLPAAFAQLTSGTNELTTIENDLMVVKIANKGGQVRYVELKKFSGKDKEGPMILVDDKSSSFDYSFTIDNRAIHTGNLYFKPTEVSAKGVTMVADFGNGSQLKQRYALKDGSYYFDASLELDNMQGLISKRDLNIDLNWTALTRRTEKDSTTSKHNSTVHYRIRDEKPTYLSETSDAAEKMNKMTDWVSLKQQFFCQTIIADQAKPFTRSEVSSREVHLKGYEKELSASLAIPYSHLPSERYNYQMYFGPLSFKVLKAADLGLERQVPIGWSFFLIAWVNRFIVIPVFNFLMGFGINFGIIILLLTIFIKVITLPFTYKSQVSMAKMKVLKPQLDALKAKYGGDMAKMQPEQMKLYRRAGVNPLGGCLPLLLQLPILVAMFRFFPSSIELRHEPFLWATDLSTYDSILDLPFTIPFYGNHVSLFTLLMTASTIIYTRMTSQFSNQPKEMMWVSYLMPIMFLGFFNSYASGLSLYYFLSNLLGFLQQYLFRIFLSEDKMKALIESNMNRPDSAIKKSRWAERIEQMQRAQQAAGAQRGGGDAPKPGGAQLPPPIRGTNRTKPTRRK